MNTTFFGGGIMRLFKRDELRCDAGKFTERQTQPALSNKNPKDLLVPMDFSPCALRALQNAVRLAQRHGSSITLLFVLEEARVSPSYRADIVRTERKLVADAEAHFAQIIKSAPPSVRFVTRIVKGGAYEQILKAARQTKIDLIVMGKRKHAVWNFFRRQTVRRVVEHAACDVIVIAEENKTA